MTFRIKSPQELIDSMNRDAASTSIHNISNNINLLDLDNLNDTRVDLLSPPTQFQDLETQPPTGNNIHVPTVTTEHVQVPTGNNIHVPTVTIEHVQGPTGSRGAQGPKGNVGERGPKGPKGNRGPRTIYLKESMLEQPSNTEWCTLASFVYDPKRDQLQNVYLSLSGVGKFQVDVIDENNKSISTEYGDATETKNVVNLSSFSNNKKQFQLLTVRVRLFEDDIEDDIEDVEEDDNTEKVLYIHSLEIVL